MDACLSKRRGLKGKVTRINTAIESYGDRPVPPRICEKYESQLTQLWDELQEVHDEIGTHCKDEDFDPHQVEFNLLASRIEALQIKLPVTVDAEKKSTDSRSTNVKLPKLELPTFSGTPHEWTSFFDLFSASVIGNDKLSGAQKLQYLKASLRGEAILLIQSLQITDDNFLPAWQILQKRYQNTRELVNSHLKRLCSLTPLTSEAPSALRKLIDVTNETVRALRVLNVPVDGWDAILVHIISEKLDPDSRRQWELSLTSTEIAKFDDFVNFLEQRARALLTCSNEKQRSGVKPTPTHFERRAPVTSIHHANTGRDSCRICKGKHAVYRCHLLIGSSPEDRRNMVKTHSLCFNCLSGEHGWKNCKAGSCRKCGGNHHTLLHLANNAVQVSPETTKVVATHTSEKIKEQPYQVLLATALVLIQDGNGSTQVCRALLDSGSQATFVSESYVQRLGLPRCRARVTVQGINAAPVNVSKGVTSLSVSSRMDPQLTLNVDAIILKRVTGTLPSFECDPTSWSHIHTLKLADPAFYTPTSVDLLLGADVIAEVMKEGLRKGPTNTPIAQESAFGWLISGKCPSPISNYTVMNNLCQVDLDAAVERFWQIESAPTSKPLTKEEKLCEEHFTKTHERNSEGRYVVRLPFKDTEIILDAEDSRNISIRRLKGTERRLSQFEERKQSYSEFLTEYESLGHMVQVDPNEVKPVTGIYLPHHAVLREANATTPLRVVFDASAKCRTGMSLNDHLMVGPQLQEELYSILIRFRTHLIALTADITKMYRQILIHDNDIKYQSIVWRNSESEPIRDYRLRTVTYGTSSAPYLATKCLQQLAKDESETFPRASEIAQRDFYMDDLMSGTNTVEDAKLLQDQLTKLLSRGGFELRKWASNASSLIDSLPAGLRHMHPPLQIEADEQIKTLGLIWSPSADQFSFCLTSQQPTSSTTKRTLLSTMAKIFDPLGWLSPVTIKAKIIFQGLWKTPCAWDDVLPVQVEHEWSNYLTDLPSIESIRINRCLFTKTAVEYQLHGFCDASERAYSAVIYLRTRHITGEYEVSLISAKTRVSPIKQVSLPRLELCGALLLARLLDAVQMALHLPIQGVYAWTDSTITLSWIQACPSKWKTFVANRVVEIQEKVPAEQWYHVKGIENPADCASRGISPSQLKDHPLWWQGPGWLKTQDLPTSISDLESTTNETELEAKVVLTNLVVSPNPMFSAYSSVSKLTRITAWIFRFMHNCRANKTEKHTGPISTVEINAALLHWIKVAQKEEFAQEISCMLEKKPLPHNSQLVCLNPFLDALGLVRVGGRLRNAKIYIERKHPLLLPRHHVLTTMIVRQEHLRQLHAGPQLLLASLQQRFWIMCGRDVSRKCVQQCITCHRQRAEMQRPTMGDLPSARVTSARPFLKCGVDYAGPFTLRALKLRGQKSYKAYIAVFVCFVTHAVHLELVSDLTTDAFIAALKRFVSRRGICAEMYSDCGTNFIGANKELKLFLNLTRNPVHNDKVSRHLSEGGTTWHFNPPAAPHFGGLWEAGVKSVKYHLRRIVGNVSLNYEEMYTILTQVEACLNSRPLCALSNDPNDLTALTPGHFLIGDVLTAIPEPNYTALKISHLSRWQLLQQLLQHFWNRWHREYLSRLQQRPKAWIKTSEIKINDLVLIKEDHQPPSKWQLGRILQTHPGADGIVRVVTIKTASGECRRPTVKISKLPIDSQ